MATPLADIDGVGAATLRVFHAAGFTHVRDLMNPTGQESRKGLWPLLERDVLARRIQETIDALKASRDEPARTHEYWRHMASRCNTVIRRLRHSEALPFAPDCLCCPITMDWFLDPVVTKYGESYERDAIERHVRDHGTDPLSRRPLSLEDLFPNRAMREAVQYHQRHFLRFAVPLRPL